MVRVELLKILFDKFVLLTVNHESTVDNLTIDSIFLFPLRRREVFIVVKSLHSHREHSHIIELDRLSLLLSPQLAK
jgi:hypothetical protein